MSRPKILIQLDPDTQPSVFDGVVAVDAGVDQLFRHGGVQPADVTPLVHGAIFTRGPADLQRTAIFIGGSNVAAGEALLAQAVKSFFGPFSVSVMFDANGANTTAAAAVIAAGRHVNLAQAEALVLAGTGPVGQRAARLLAREGTRVKLASRRLDRAAEACAAIAAKVPGATLTPVAPGNDADLVSALQGVSVVIAAGAAGIQLLSAPARRAAGSLRVAIDLNAVPPLGIEGYQAHEKEVDREGVIGYGALGVGGTKMKIHRAALQQLFTANHLILDAEEIYHIGRGLEV